MSTVPIVISTTQRSEMNLEPTEHDLTSLYTSMSDAKILEVAAEGNLTTRGAKSLDAELSRRRMTTQDVERVRSRMNYVEAPPPFRNFVAYPLGLGVTFRGKKFVSGSDFEAEIRTSTRWIIVFWIPLIPISTWRIIDLGTQRQFGGWSRGYQVVQKVRFDWRQVLGTWAKAVIVVLAIAGLFRLMK